MSFQEDDRSDPNFRWRSFNTDWRNVDISVSFFLIWRPALSKGERAVALLLVQEARRCRLAIIEFLEPSQGHVAVSRDPFVIDELGWN